jgi:hypothetical protein
MCPYVCVCVCETKSYDSDGLGKGGSFVRWREQEATQEGIYICMYHTYVNSPN